jgi:hypothetical protein
VRLECGGNLLDDEAIAEGRVVTENLIWAGLAEGMG